MTGSRLPRMEGKVGLITGATSGLGLAAAGGCARLGATVWLAVRNRERGEAARARILEHSGRSRRPRRAVRPEPPASRCDASPSASPARRNGSTSSSTTPGSSPRSASCSPDGIELTLATNVIGLVPAHPVADRAARAQRAVPDRQRVLGGMYTQKLRVDDLQSEQGEFDGPTVYARTKRAEVILTEMWAQRLAGTGVTVHAMHPGWVDTGGLESVAAAVPQRDPTTAPRSSGGRRHDRLAGSRRGACGQLRRVLARPPAPPHPPAAEDPETEAEREPSVGAVRRAQRPTQVPAT